MTACAMSVGMVPMALALERGSQMQAPLGRAVIGGLVMSTFATLLVLPSIFAMVIGRRVATSPSIYPDDPDSKHYDPHVFVDETMPVHGEHPQPNVPEHSIDAKSVMEAAPDGQNLEVLNFLGRILSEARSHRRHDMTTHFTVEDLLVALGFAESKNVENPNNQDERNRDSDGTTPKSEFPSSH
jgi:hypothetical protein